jgi:hypothetical protein
VPVLDGVNDHQIDGSGAPLHSLTGSLGSVVASVMLTVSAYGSDPGDMTLALAKLSFDGAAAKTEVGSAMAPTSTDAIARMRTIANPSPADRRSTLTERNARIDCHTAGRHSQPSPERRIRTAGLRRHKPARVNFVPTTPEEPTTND